MSKNHRSKQTSEAAIEAGDIDALRRSLSYRQRRFCEEFIVDYNATAAAIRAGYKHGKYIDRQAHQLLHHTGCEAYIAVLEKDKKGKIVSVNPEYVIKQVTAIVGNEFTKDGDKLRGLELLARHLGMFVDRTEITGKDGGALEFEQRVREESADLVSALKRMAEKQKKNVELI